MGGINFDADIRNAGQFLSLATPRSESFSRTGIDQQRHARWNTSDNAPVTTALLLDKASRQSANRRGQGDKLRGIYRRAAVIYQNNGVNSCENSRVHDELRHKTWF